MIFWGIHSKSGSSNSIHMLIKFMSETRHCGTHDDIYTLILCYLEPLQMALWKWHDCDIFHRHNMLGFIMLAETSPNNKIYFLFPRTGTIYMYIAASIYNSLLVAVPMATIWPICITILWLTQILVNCNRILPLTFWNYCVERWRKNKQVQRCPFICICSCTFVKTTTSIFFSFF